MRDKTLSEQLEALIALGNKSGLHDAADWLRAHVDQARVLYNVEREREAQLHYLSHFSGEALTQPELRERLVAMFPTLTTPKAHALVGKYLRENGRVNTVKGVLVS